MPRLYGNEAFDMAIALRLGCNRVGGIHDQVQKDLVQLSWQARYLRQIRVEVGFQIGYSF